MIINTVLIVKSYIYPNKVPSVFGYKPFIVLSGSMEPSFSTGSVVYYTKVSTSDLKAGDIITFEGNSGIIISHRIEKVNSQFRSYDD